MAGVRILVVGDPVAAREMGVRLATVGYVEATIAASGAEAVATAARSAPDLILMDAAPGEMDGMAAVDAIRRQHSIPTLFVTTESGPPSPAEPTRAVPRNVLERPFSDRELGLAIELALRRHDAEEAVHELDRFFSASIDLFCFLDFNGYFRRLNPAWETTLGFTLEELMSRPFIEFVHPDDRERTLTQNARVRTGDQAMGFENRYLCKDGSYRWLHWNAASRIAGVIYSVARDVTEQKRAEEERALLTRTLEASLAEVRALQDILPICMYCKQIRDDKDYWHSVESYISRHTNTRFSHGICPSCLATEVEPMLKELEDR
ncbi:MAG TPA: PAS domain S-box protein [Gemmatimonadota bacterium]|nr:PAS domain S-box protein [Gemmatimonadota bacterium]